MGENVNEYESLCDSADLTDDNSDDDDDDENDVCEDDNLSSTSSSSSSSSASSDAFLEVPLNDMSLNDRGGRRGQCWKMSKQNKKNPSKIVSFISVSKTTCNAIDLTGKTKTRFTLLIPQVNLNFFWEKELDLAICLIQKHCQKNASMRSQSNSFVKLMVWELSEFPAFSLK